jgi:hypothetical protein
MSVREQASHNHATVISEGPAALWSPVVNCMFTDGPLVAGGGTVNVGAVGRVQSMVKVRAANCDRGAA